MSKRCAAKTCFNTTSCKPTLKFFKFPKDKEMCRLWAERCGRPDLLELPPEKLANARLCADHFETRWFLNPQFKTAFVRNSEPVPTIFHNNLREFIPKSLKKNYVSSKGSWSIPRFIAIKKAKFESQKSKNVTSEDKVSPLPQPHQFEVSTSVGCHKMCRLCACLVQEAKLINIFSSQHSDIIKKINRFLRKSAWMGDGLPHYSCESCIEKLNYCEETVSSFIAADTKLRELSLAKPVTFMPSDGDSSYMLAESSKNNESSPAVGRCNKVFMLRKKNKEQELEMATSGDNVFDGGEFEVLSKDQLDCEVRDECLSPSVDDSGNYLEGDLVQFVSVHLEQDSFLRKSDVENDTLSAAASETTLLTKTYSCKKCGLNFSEKSKLLFHEISEHVVEGKAKIKNTGDNFKVDVSSEQGTVSNTDKQEMTTCKLCGQGFIGQRSLKKHMRDCHVLKAIICLYCGARFTAKSQLLDHLRLHTNEKPYSCSLCDAKFHFKKELRRHKLLHTKSQAVACNVCSKVFNSRHYLWRHKRTHSQNRCVLCYLCGKVLSNAQSLKVHLRTHSSERPCTCSSCGKKFKDDASLSKHVVMHSVEKNFKCDVCSRAFYSMALVKQHKLSHSGVKPFKCDECGSCFNRLGNLNQHKKRHLRKEELDQSNLDTLFECSVCGKKMRSELTLKYHIAKHTGEKKPFDCETCGKRFIALEPYRVHVRIHTGERPYVCGVCNKSFRSPYTLKQHAGLHRDEFPYACPYCERRFKRLQSLIVHKRTHTGEKPHVCPLCGRCFAQKGDMLKHTKTHKQDHLPPANKDQGDELVLEMDQITDFALSDTEITNEFLINMPIVEVQTEIQ